MAECKFQVGDIVTIRDWSDMAYEYGIDECTGSIKTPLVYPSDMKCLCGEISTITKITPLRLFDSYLIKLARNEHGYFGDDFERHFCQEMFKSARYQSKFSNRDYFAVLDSTI